MVENLNAALRDYINQSSQQKSKDLGQYHTREEIANFMASMIRPIKDNGVINILDAGAGTGVLTVAAVSQLIASGHKSIHAVLYELDKDILPILHKHMEELSSSIKHKKAEFTYQINAKNFVTTRPDKKENIFHIAIINPPYFKYSSKDSIYANATSDLFVGNPNIYASFMAVATACLKSKGQLIAIVPRSFTNGLYFKGFRNFLNKVSTLQQIHVFKTRNKLFNQQSVLQENIICHYIKDKISYPVKISSSMSYQDLNSAEFQYYSSDFIVDNSTELQLIRIPETTEDARILEIAENFSNSFTECGLTISTGPVVEHRTKEYISNKQKNYNAIPLLRMHNIKPLKIEWDGIYKKDAHFKLITGYEKHISRNQPYVILKRFSSKDEKRRLVAGVNKPSTFSKEYIALENHLNYIHSTTRKFTLNEAYGIAVLLNSTFMDKYFRCVSGNTQVNATEIRTLKLPGIQTIKDLGKKAQKWKQVNQHKIDNLISNYITI